MCKVSEFFNTQRTGSVGASAWQASKPPSPCKLALKLPPDAGGAPTHRPALSPRPVAFPRRPPSRWKRRDLWEVAQGRGAHGARSPTLRGHLVPDAEAPPSPLLWESGGGREYFANIHRAMATIADFHHGNLAPPLPRPDAGGATVATEGGWALV